jgi:hypothetical protein
VAHIANMQTIICLRSNGIPVTPIHDPMNAVLNDAAGSVARGSMGNVLRWHR